MESQTNIIFILSFLYNFQIKYWRREDNETDHIIKL